MQYAGGGEREISDFKGREGVIWFKWEEGLLCNAGRVGISGLKGRRRGGLLSKG